MKSTFFNYFNFREEVAGSKQDSVTSHIKLQKNGEKTFAPFSIDKNSRPNLRAIVKAFENSKNVGLGYKTIDKSKGEHEPLLKKKTLYLTGGAVRDHLKGKTPKNHDLVTDATMSEIRMILKSAEPKFVEVKPPNKSTDKEYIKLPDSIGKNRYFYVSKWDSNNKETEFTIVVNKEKFFLAPFSKGGKSRVVPQESETATSVEEDAQDRDFTINSLYIPLNNSDGDNSDLIDPFGGANHLKQNSLKPINNDLKSKLSADPSTALKYVTFIHKFGDPSSISDQDIDSIKNIDMSPVSKDYIKQKFISTLEDKDVNARDFVKTCDKTGVLKFVFPGLNFNVEDIPENFKGDRWLSTAWILKDNEIEEVKKLLLDNSWTRQEANDIVYLINLYQWGKNDFHHSKFYDMKNSQVGLSKNKIKEWLDIVNLKGKKSDSFLNHDDSDLGAYVDNNGKRTINPKYVEFLGRTPLGNEFELVKKILSTNRFKDSI